MREIGAPGRVRNGTATRAAGSLGHPQTRPDETWTTTADRSDRPIPTRDARLFGATTPAREETIDG